MFTKILSLACAVALSCVLSAPAAFAQCLTYPLPFSGRIDQSAFMLIGKVTGKQCYADQKGNIYTRNRVEVEAWIKGHRPDRFVYVITIGGVLEGKAQLSFPAVQLDAGSRYFLMLEGDNHLSDDKATRTATPGMLQAMPYADAQGAWLYQNGAYHDLHTEGALPEAGLLQRIAALAGLEARTPEGVRYTARIEQARTTGTAEVISFSPNPTNAGTVNPADYLTITGSGFGAAPGSVEFRNADNGGSTFITPPNASDYVSWSDNTIVVKVPSGQTELGEARNAGTGPFLVNGFMASPQALVINYSHISINSNFSGFPERTRQRYYLRNLDGQGGYTFLYNTGFQSNAAAVTAFEKALNTWKCSTGINWRTGGNTISGYAADNENVVLFDASLPAGVLARASSRFSGSATGSCNLQNTVWWLNEIDVQVKPDGAGISWQYGPAFATGSQYDFETVVLHELGHAHGLGHRIAPGQLMHYAVAAATNIRTPAPQEVQGGLAKMAYSVAPTCFNPSGSGTPMIAAAACSLPLKLISFTGALKNHAALLQWKTQHEMNVREFELQRSTDGSNFTAIAHIAAKGNGAAETVYEYTDAQLKPGINHYRLKMIDKDGSFEYSPVITIKLDGAVRRVVITPNPAAHELQIISAFDGRLNMWDATGKLVNSIRLSAGTTRVDISSFSNGVYYLAEPAGTAPVKLLIMR